MKERILLSMCGCELEVDYNLSSQLLIDILGGHWGQGWLRHLKLFCRCLVSVTSPWIQGGVPGTMIAVRGSFHI